MILRESQKYHFQGGETVTGKNGEKYGEKFGTLVSIIPPAGWLALTGLSLITTVLVLWCFFGRISETVTGKGILVDVDGINSIEALTEGEIVYVTVDVGDFVEKGQPVAQIWQAGLLEEINKLKREIVLLQKFLILSTDLYNEKRTRNQNYIKALNDNITSNIRDLAQSRDAVRELKNLYKNLADRTVIPRTTYMQVVRNYLDSEITLNNTHNTLLELPFKAYLTDFEDQRVLIAAKTRLDVSRDELEYLQEKFNNYSVVRSLSAGRILEISTHTGEVVKPGSVLMTLSDEKNKTLELVAFISPYHGKRVKVGMAGQISPSTVRPEEYGYLQGAVTFVSNYPESHRAIMATIKNQKLVEELTADKPAIRVVVETFPDNTTISGLKWTSSKGPAERIGSGTLCEVRINYKSMPPVAYVVPAVKKLLGME